MKPSVSYWEDLHHHQNVEEIWMSHPSVRSRINERITGNPNRWPMDWLGELLSPLLPLKEVVSVGCGVGNLERDLVRRKIAETVIGIDSVASAVESARAAAEAEGMQKQITYLVADAQQYLRQQNGLDGIFFHASLHHFERPRDILDSCSRALQPKGILYLDEYVGPSRHEWRWRALALLNLVYYLLPQSVRRVRVIRKPVNRDDPSEAVSSSDIVPSVEAHFTILHKKNYGGNLLSVLYPNLRRLEGQDAASKSEVFDAAINFLLDLEDVLLRNRSITTARSYYTMIVASPRAA